MELFAESYELQALREENQWLLQCLQASERNCKQFQSVIKQQQRRIKALETQVPSQHQDALVRLEREWKSRLQQREKKWMQEYGSHMQSLLQIIRHHESVRVRLDEELEQLRSSCGCSCNRGSARDGTCLVSSATQTDSAQGDGERSQCHHTAKRTSEGTSCGRVHCQQQHTEAPSNSTSVAVQELFRKLHMSTVRAQSKSNKYLEMRAKQHTHAAQEVGFRASVLERLRRPNHLLSQSRTKLPPTIPEEGEEQAQEVDEDGTVQARENSSSELASALVGSNGRAVSSSSFCRTLEEQNRVLQDRLASQQTVLDQILDTKLQDAASTTIVPQKVRSGATAAGDQMIKLNDHHFEARDSSIQVPQRVERLEAADRSQPLSPSAA